MCTFQLYKNARYHTPFRIAATTFSHSEDETEEKKQAKKEALDLTKQPSLIFIYFTVEFLPFLLFFQPPFAIKYITRIRRPNPETGAGRTKRGEQFTPLILNFNRIVRMCWAKLENVSSKTNAKNRTEWLNDPCNSLSCIPYKFSWSLKEREEKFH